MTFDWKKLIGTVAPTIAGAFGTPLAGLAVKAAVEAFGLSDSTEEALAAAVQGATPEDLLRLKTADNEFRVAMKKLDLDVQRLGNEDMHSARQREVMARDPTTRNLAYAYTTGYFTLLGVVITQGLPAGSESLVTTLIGILSAAQVSIMAYYFGSSAGSAMKTRLMADDKAGA